MYLDGVSGHQVVVAAYGGRRHPCEEAVTPDDRRAAFHDDHVAVQRHPVLWWRKVVVVSATNIKALFTTLQPSDGDSRNVGKQTAVGRIENAHHFFGHFFLPETLTHTKHDTLFVQGERGMPSLSLSLILTSPFASSLLWERKKKTGDFGGRLLKTRACGGSRVHGRT